MASSVDHNKLPNICGGATAAPPPTPSSQTNHLSTSAAAEALSRLLHRLPPKLSLPTRRSSSVISPPTISFSDSPDDEFSSRLLSAVSEFGFFQITDHKISSHLLLSAESESAALFDIQAEKKEALFPKDWGFIGDEDEESDGACESFCFDPRLCLPYSDEICLQALQELVPAMEYLGLKIIEPLFRAIGLENPIGEDRSRFRSLIWISKGSRSAEPAVTCGFYPYIVGLHYQSKNQRCSVLGDSGWVATAATAADSVMVSIGDIAQVWSNGKVKKVRGRAVAAAADGSDNSGTISISLLITLPLDTQVSPLLPPTDENTDAEAKEDGGGNEAEKKTAVFRSFSFEEYAWKVYQNRCFLLRDPLAGYRI